ncbi:MAG: potassium channel protein [Betaproteobacteria bacterium]|nr:potassium channel protein [Betaproteobacteria bacterium]
MKLSEITTSHVYRSFAWAFLSLVLVMVIGTLGYHIIGGPQYSWVDCFYMTFITVATIGFNEVIDLSNSPVGRLFTVFVAIFGIGAMTYLLSALTAFILEGDINEAWRRRKMQSKIEKLKDHYIVCGIRRVGINVAHELESTNRASVIVDQDLERIEHYLSLHPEQLYLHGDPTDNDVLLAAGVERAVGIFAVAADNSQNLVISLSAKQINPKLRVVARCHDVKNFDKTRRAGADEIVSPDFIGGMRIVSAMVRPNVVSFLDDMIKSDENLRMEEVVIPSGFSSELLTLFNPDLSDCILLAIKQGGKWAFNPAMQHTVHSGDILMVMTTPNGRRRLEELIQGVA